MAISQWQPAVVRLPNITTTGIAHGYVRWPEGRPPIPFGCRWCGTQQGHHGRSYMRGRGMHGWEQPTQAQIKARMLARRAARKAVCRCPLDDEWRLFAPVFDPYMCEAPDCHGYTSEMNPFGGGGAVQRSIHGPGIEISRVCGCGFRTTVWHVDDGSAEEELHGHVSRVHGGAVPAAEAGGV
ncbi:hypothetical protein [Streptomyces sp. NPDC056948]|uniref:hypothetical protein n=1 Tax=Streptomyces sp. NPDC056948 TaxID=3345975 RepID=UPI003635B6CF